MIYYGTEQGLHGGDKPQNREALWPYYDTDSDLYKFISILAKFRAQQGSSLYESPQVECYADDQVYAFTRGMVSALEMPQKCVGEHLQSMVLDFILIIRAQNPPHHAFLFLKGFCCHHKLWKFSLKNNSTPSLFGWDR